MTDAPPPYPGINGYNGYAAAAGGPPLGGAAASAPPTQQAGGFVSSADAKAAEAAGGGPAYQPQQGWYDPNNPHTAYVPQNGGDMPPSYDDSQKKKDA